MTVFPNGLLGARKEGFPESGLLSEGGGRFLPGVLFSSAGLGATPGLGYGAVRAPNRVLSSCCTHPLLRGLAWAD